MVLGVIFVPSEAVLDSNKSAWEKGSLSVFRIREHTQKDYPCYLSKIAGKLFLDAKAVA